MKNSINILIYKDCHIINKMYKKLFTKRIIKNINFRYCNGGTIKIEDNDDKKWTYKKDKTISIYSFKDDPFLFKFKMVIDMDGQIMQKKDDDKKYTNN